MLVIVNRNSEDQMGVITTLHGEALSQYDWNIIKDYIFGKDNSTSYDYELGVELYVKNLLIKHGDWRVH